MSALINDLLGRMLMSLVPLAARRFDRSFEARIDAYEAEQAKLRARYQIDAETMIRGYDAQTRSAVQAYADSRSDVRLAYTSGSTSEPKALAYPPQRLKSFKAESRSIGVRAWAKVGIRQSSIFVLSSLANDSSFTSLAVYQSKEPALITGIVEPARYLFRPAMRTCIEHYGATAVRFWLMVLSNPGLIYSTNPSTLAVFLLELHEQWSACTAMIRDFLKAEGVAGSAPVRRIAGRTMRRGAAKRLLAIASAQSPLPMDVMLPGLSAYCCWDGGYVRSFLKQIRGWLPAEHYTHIPMFAMSTETIETLTWFGPEGEMRFLPMGPGVLYEFLPEGAQDVVENIELPWQLVAAKTYTMIVSDPYGLRRYQTEDLFVCEGMVRGVPDLRFARRRGLTWSFTGEKITGEQLSAAYEGLELSVHGLSESAAQLTTLPSWPSDEALPRYHLMVGHPSTQPDIDVSTVELARAFDELLSGANQEYRDKRLSGRLAAAEVTLLPYARLAEALDDLRSDGGDNRARSWESQFKLTPLTRTKLQDIPKLAKRVD